MQQPLALAAPRSRAWVANGWHHAACPNAVGSRAVTTTPAGLKAQSCAATAMASPGPWWGDTQASPRPLCSPPPTPKAAGQNAGRAHGLAACSHSNSKPRHTAGAEDALFKGSLLTQPTPKGSGGQASNAGPAATEDGAELSRSNAGFQALPRRSSKMRLPRPPVGARMRQGRGKCAN